MLPGNRDTLHVFMPEWSAFFDELLLSSGNGAINGTSGAVYIHCLRAQNGKVNTIGTLMEVLDYRRLDGGRLLLVAHGVARVRLLPDKVESSRPSDGGSGDSSDGCDDDGGTRGGGPLYVERFAEFLPDWEVTARASSSRYTSGEEGAGNAGAASKAISWEALWSGMDLPRELPRGWAAKGCDALCPTPGMGTFVREPGATQGVAEGLGGDQSREGSGGVDEGAAPPTDTLAPGGIWCSAEVAAAEAAIWEELGLFVGLAGRLRSTGVFCLPAALIALRPAIAPPSYSPLRRAWRLSYALAQLLDIPKGSGEEGGALLGDNARSLASSSRSRDPSRTGDNAGESEARATLTRQTLLECGGIAERLGVCLDELRVRRKMMAAALALEGARGALEGGRGRGG